MDYTTLARVKAEAIKTEQTTDDALLALLITSASRAIDKKCTGVAYSDCEDYFKLEAVTDELTRGQLTSEGSIFCAPRKPEITSVSAMSYKLNYTDSWSSIGSTYIEADGPFARAHLNLSYPPRTVWVKISYTGGLGESVNDLPADLIELATLLCARFYKEAETGLNDAIGVAELGTLIYTKAWPIRFVEMIAPYQRVVGWRGY